MIFTIRCCASSTSFMRTLVVTSRSSRILSAIRPDIFLNSLPCTSSFAALSASTRSRGSQSRTKRCTERSSMVMMSSNTNIRLRISSASSSLYALSPSKMVFSLERSRLFITSATKSMPPTWTLLLLKMFANRRVISASIILIAAGDALSICAMLSTTWICRRPSSCSITAAALSGST